MQRDHLTRSIPRLTSQPECCDCGEGDGVEKGSGMTSALAVELLWREIDRRRGAQRLVIAANPKEKQGGRGE